MTLCDYLAHEGIPAQRDNLYQRPEYVPAVHNPSPPARPGALDYQKIPSLINSKRRPYQHAHHFSKGKEND